MIFAGTSPGGRWTLQAWLSSNGASSIAPANKLTRWLISGTDDKGSPHCGEVRRRDPGFRPQASHRRTVPYLNVSVQPPRHSYSFRRGVGFSFHLAPPVTKRIVAPRAPCLLDRSTPRRKFSFFCLQNSSDAVKKRNQEGHFPNLPSHTIPQLSCPHRRLIGIELD